MIADQQNKNYWNIETLCSYTRSRNFKNVKAQVIYLLEHKKHKT